MNRSVVSEVAAFASEVERTQTYDCQAEHLSLVCMYLPKETLAQFLRRQIQRSFYSARLKLLRQAAMNRFLNYVAFLSLPVV